MVKMFIKAIAGLFESIAQGLIDFVVSIFAYMGYIGEFVLGLDIVQTGIIFSQVLALSLLILKVAYESLMTYLLRQSGDVTTNPTYLLVGTVRAVGIIGVMPWLVAYLLKFGLTLTSDVQTMETINTSNPDNSTFSIFLNLIANAGSQILIFAVGVIFAIIMLLIVLIQSFIRAADLAVEAWFGCFAALGLTNPQSQSWSRWFHNMIAIAITPAVQLGLIKFAFSTLLPLRIPINGNDMELPAVVNLLLFMSVIWVTYRAPNTIKDKLHSTGVGRVSGAVTQMASQSIIMRMVRRR